MKKRCLVVMASVHRQLRLQSVDVVLLAPSVDLEMEEAGVGIAFPEPGEVRGLTTSRTLHGGQAQDAHFEEFSERRLQLRELPRLLRHVESEDQLSREMELEAGVTEM